MKYAKIENDQLLVKEVEKGQEVGGKLTEEEIIAQGYKPYCETEKPEGADFFINREYETCIVQEWGTITEEPGISREALLFLSKTQTATPLSHSRFRQKTTPQSSRTKKSSQH